MEYPSNKSVLSVLLVTGLLLILLLGQSLAVAPGDEDGCPVPQYPVHVRKVLMDSWRYHTLITGERRVWTATTEEGHRTTWSSQGTCSGGSASVCARGRKEKWVVTQFINKSLPESHTDPLRIYVDVTYSFTDCLGGQQHCNVELFLANYSNNHRSGYGSGGIMPDNLIANGISSGTKQFFFDSDTSFTGFFLALTSVEACVTVSRVLVYRYECPGSDRLPPTSLLRRPATPVNVREGLRLVKPYCAENAHLGNETLTIACRSDGIWNDGVVARCECDSGYREDEEGTTCKEISPHKTTTEDSANPTPSASLSSSSFVAGRTTVLVNSDSRDVTSFISPSATPSHPIKDTTSGKPTTTPTEDPTVEDRSGEDDREGGSGGPSTAILAGVGASLVIILVALVLVIVLVLIIVRNHNKKSKNNQIHISSDGKQLSNPVYDGVSRNIPVSASNGNGLTGHKQDTDTLRDFHNPLYHTPQHSRHSNGVSENHTSQNGKFFDEPQYSVPDGNGIAQSEYELPVTTPTTSPPPPPVYDYATPAMAPEYATLDPPVHTYHTVEPNGPAGRGGEENVEEQEYSFIGEK